MSDYAYVAEHARKIFASVSRLETELEKNPDSWAASRNLRSMQKVAMQARAELERLAAVKKIEVCDYRIVPESDWHYSLVHVAKSFLSYQLLFSQIYDAFKNGKKERAIIGAEASAESALDFAYSYSGSLGVVLLCKSVDTFFEGNLDKPIESLFNVINISSSDEVRSVANSLGRAVVKRVHDWSNANVEGEFSTDLQWRKSDGKLFAQKVGFLQMERITGLIDEAAEDVHKTEDILGVLVAVSLPARSFHITVPNGETYVGHFSKDFMQPEEMTVGRRYRARIAVTSTYFYATGESKNRNSLLALEGPLGFEGAES